MGNEVIKAVGGCIMQDPTDHGQNFGYGSE